MCKSSFGLFFVRNYKYVVLLRFKDSKLYLNNSLSAKIVFSLLAKSIGLGLVIIKSSVYSTNLAFLSVTMRKSFIYAREIQMKTLKVR